MNLIVKLAIVAATASIMTTKRNKPEVTRHKRISDALTTSMKTADARLATGVRRDSKVSNVVVVNFRKQT